jgi:hypothetical protein
MKSTIKNHKTKPTKIKYPWLGQGKYDSGLVVFFLRAGSGVVVGSANASWNLGDDSNDWAMDAFEQFEGKITLENE